jgi:hypothetical protein
MSIQGDTLTYHHFSNATFTAHIGTDGSLKDAQHKFGGDNAMVVKIVPPLTGQVTSAGITVDAKSQFRNYPLTLKR